jgi:signal transduction histidine kinase
MYSFLKKVPLFAELPEDDLRRLCGLTREVKLAAGEELFAEGSPGDEAYIIREGSLQIVKTSIGRGEIELAVHGPGVVIGEMALLEDRPRMASVRAVEDSVLVVIHKEQMDHLLSTSLSASHAMFHTILSRLRATESLLRQNEKMAQLGTLAAGVTHELNNPAAAVRRGADQLQSALVDYGQAQSKINQIAMSESQELAIQRLNQRAQEQAAQPPEMDAMTRSDREYELETWLEERDIEDSWELAPMLVNLDYEPEELSTLVGCFSDAELAEVISWLNATYDVYNLMSEIGRGAQRISEIVKALKSYSYLDRAPVQAVNVHEGLDDTLLILRHKLKAGINVRRQYDPDLPRIEAYGSELNQVWTNIIDNAADALEGQGEISIRTRQVEDMIVVEIEDNGPGMPPEVKARIFDPFFTTKPPGSGTGLGLDISYNIVVNKHHGDIKVHSEPGKTCFEVWLPVNFDA